MQKRINLSPTSDKKICKEPSFRFQLITRANKMKNGAEKDQIKQIIPQRPRQIQLMRRIWEHDQRAVRGVSLHASGREILSVASQSSARARSRRFLIPPALVPIGPDRITPRQGSIRLRRDRNQGFRGFLGEEQGADWRVGVQTGRKWGCDGYREPVEGRIGVHRWGVTLNFLVGFIGSGEAMREREDGREEGEKGRRGQARQRER